MEGVCASSLGVVYTGYIGSDVYRRSLCIPRSTWQCASCLALCGTGLDEQDITVLNNVVLALCHDLALRLHTGLITLLLQHIVVVHDSLNEGLLKVAVNDTSSLRCLGAVAKGPLPNLVRASGEEGAEVECLAHGGDDLGQGRLGAELLALLISLSIGLKACQALLEADGDWDDGVASRVLLYPLGDLGQVLVLLTDVVAF